MSKSLLSFSSVQSLSRVRLFATPWIAACQASLSITNSWSPLKLMPIESVMPSSHLILCRSLLLLPPIPPSIRVFSSESALCMRWPKYWSFSFSINPSNEHPGLISFRMDWLDLLAVQGTLKSLLQHHSSKALIFQCSDPYQLLKYCLSPSSYTIYYSLISGSVEKYYIWWFKNLHLENVLRFFVYKNFRKDSDQIRKKYKLSTRFMSKLVQLQKRGRERGRGKNILENLYRLSEDHLTCYKNI